MLDYRVIYKGAYPPLPPFKREVIGSRKDIWIAFRAEKKKFIRLYLPYQRDY
jgi:hypothetical protein